MSMSMSVLVFVSTQHENEHEKRDKEKNTDKDTDTETDSDTLKWMFRNDVSKFMDDQFVILKIISTSISRFTASNLITKQ